MLEFARVELKNTIEEHETVPRLVGETVSFPGIAVGRGVAVGRAGVSVGLGADVETAVGTFVPSGAVVTVCPAEAVDCVWTAVADGLR